MTSFLRLGHCLDHHWPRWSLSAGPSFSPVGCPRSVGGITCFMRSRRQRSQPHHPASCWPEDHRPAQSTFDGFASPGLSDGRMMATKPPWPAGQPLENFRLWPDDRAIDDTRVELDRGWKQTLTHPVPNTVFGHRHIIFTQLGKAYVVGHKRASIAKSNCYIAMGTLVTASGNLVCIEGPINTTIHNLVDAVTLLFVARFHSPQ